MCDHRFCEFNLVNISTAVHRIAKFTDDVDHVRETGAFTRLLTAQISCWSQEVYASDVLGLVHSSWAFAKLLIVDQPCLDSIAAAARRKIR